MFEFGTRRRSWAAKVIAISAAGMGIGFGTCGLGFMIGRGGVGVAGFAVWAGTGLFFVSLAALVITALIALGMWIAEAFRR